MFVAEVSSLGAAYTYYNTAADPPDPDFTQLVTPQTISVPEVESMADGPLKDYAQTEMTILGLRMAESTALNRADGARLAGQPTWQAAQLLAAETFASKAVELEAQVVHWQQMLSPYISEVAEELAPNWIDFLKVNGLPNLEVSLLTQAGWTPDMIEAVRQDLILNGAQAVADPAVNDLALTLSSFLGSFTAYSDLEQAIQIRADVLGLPSRALTPEELGLLDAQRASIEAGLTAGIPSDSLIAEIDSFLSNVQSLLEQSNNLPALQDSLDFGYSALVQDQQLDAGTHGLSDFINRQVSLRQASPGVAGQLQNQVASAKAEITAGHFYDAQEVLGALATSIQAAEGQGLSASAASGLLSYVRVVQWAIPPFDQGGPIVTDVQRLGFHRQPTQISVSFNEPLGPTFATSLASYHIIATGPDGRFGTHDDRSIAIKSAVYDATTNTVTLTPARRLNLHRRYELIVNGSTATGVADVAGNLLDGNSDGRPGGNYVAILRGFGLDRPKTPFIKLIREQLGGKPISSRRVTLRLSVSVSRQSHPSPALQTPHRSLRVSTPHGPLPALPARRVR